MDLNVNFIIFGILSTVVVLSNAAHLHESADTRTYRKAAHLRQDGVGFRQASGFGSAGFETRTFTGKNSTHTSGEVLGSIPREGAVQNNITAQATRQAETPEIDQVLASAFDSQRFAETLAKWRDVLRSVDHSTPVMFFVSSAESACLVPNLVSSYMYDKNSSVRFFSLSLDAESNEVCEKDVTAAAAANRLSLTCVDLSPLLSEINPTHNNTLPPEKVWAFGSIRYKAAVVLKPLALAEAVEARGPDATFTVMVDADVVFKSSIIEWLQTHHNTSKPIVTATWLGRS